MSDLAAALAALQADLPRIRKGRKVQAGARQYKYAEYDKILAAVRPVLHKHGFTWRSVPGLRLIDGGDLRFVLHYTLEHSNGERISGDYPLTEGPPQTMGAQISYAKRYALVAVLDLEVEGEDTDAMDVPSRRPQHTPGRATGAEHERLRHGTVVATPEDRPARRGPLSAEEDVWSGPGPDAEDEPGSITPAQQRAMFAAFKQIGCEDKLKRLELTRTILKLDDLTSSNELSYSQAGTLLTALHELAASR